MRQTRTERCGQKLIDAQISINRAVFELNSRENSARPRLYGAGRRGPAPDDEYTLRCVVTAIADLGAAADVLLGRKGVRR